MDVQTVEVRATGPDDWQVRRRVRLAALKDAPYAFYSTYEQALARTDDEWRGWPSPGVVLLAWRDGRPVGIVGIGPSPEHERDADLFSMWVDPAARGSGAADALVGAAVERARDMGCTRVLLEVTAGNDRAARVYARHGFVRIDAPTSLPGSSAMALTFG